MTSRHQQTVRTVQASQVKIKQPLYRPGQTLRLPGVSGSHVSK